MQKARLIPSREIIGKQYRKLALLCLKKWYKTQRFFSVKSNVMQFTYRRKGLSKCQQSIQFASIMVSRSVNKAMRKSLCTAFANKTTCLLRSDERQRSFKNRTNDLYYISIQCHFPANWCKVRRNMVYWRIFSTDVHRTTLFLLII